MLTTFYSWCCRHPIASAVLGLVGVWHVVTALPITFLADDLRYLYEIEQHHTLSGYIHYIIQPLGSSFVWRPLINLSWLLEYKVFHYSVWAYHVVNSLLFFLTTFLFYRLVCRLIGERAAVVAALLFFVLPIHYETTIWLSGQTDGWVTLLLLLSLWLWVRYRDISSRAVLYLSYVTFGLALLAKELAIVVPVLIVVIDILWFSDRWAPRQRYFYRWLVSVREYSGYIVVAALYLSARYLILGSFVAPDPTIASQFHLMPTWLDFKLVIRSLTHWFNLSQLRDFIGPFADTWDRWHSRWALLLVIGLVVLRWSQWRSWEYRRAIIFALSLLGLCLWPMLFLLPAISADLENSRLLYVPSLGLALLLALLVAPVSELFWKRLLFRVTFFLLVILGLCGLIINYVPWLQASRLALRPLTVLEVDHADVVLLPQEASELWVSGLPATFRGVYVYHDYFSFTQAFKIHFPTSTVRATGVGIRWLSDTVMCGSDIKTTLLDWQDGTFVDKTDLISTWQQLAVLPLQKLDITKWQTKDMSIRIKDGAMVLDDFGFRPTLTLDLDKSFSATDYRSFDFQAIDIWPKDMSIELSWTPLSRPRNPLIDRIVINRNTDRPLELCHYMNWAAAGPIKQVQLQFIIPLAESLRLQSFGLLNK